MLQTELTSFAPQFLVVSATPYAFPEKNKTKQKNRGTMSFQLKGEVLNFKCIIWKFQIKTFEKLEYPGWVFCATIIAAQERE